MRTKLIYILLGMAVMACQDDIDVDTSNGDTNNKESVFTSKAERNTMLKGQVDDLLDSMPCSMVNLPVDVTINNDNLVTISTLADLEVILPGDIIKFTFPITVTNYNYETVTISNQGEFIKLQEECSTRIDNGEGPITCVDIEYPIYIFSALGDNAQTSHNLESDEEFYLYLTNLSENENYSINYPINISVNNSTTVTIENDASFTEYLDGCDN
ncbi:hypothetical protein OOZ15_13255 [Galbibacter sp. EGI 63066]|uniref:hypothetical protein n=1 Tax=Galbibacter sp. EGI 63066 TaxID=2993559 RepID=UPI002248911C|nr:hypothetical protein [Galbibacter sp. EGI 63066]MCX2680914.1 hypothetical protein [Galbibacter sp. EGI 63066]